MRGFVARNRWMIVVAVTAFVLDQVTKAIVVATLPRHSSWPEEGFFRFTYVGNTGSAFGLFDGQNTILIVGALLGLLVLVFFYRSHPNPGFLVKASLGLMLAGALGNLSDRITRGHVVDFVDVGPFWIFNVADACISVGLVMLAVSALFFDQGKPVPEDETPEHDELAVPAGGPPEHELQAGDENDAELQPSDDERRDDDRRA